jgi:hypothetical protein
MLSGERKGLFENCFGGNIAAKKKGGKGDKQDRQLKTRKNSRDNNGIFGDNNVNDANNSGVCQTSGLWCVALWYWIIYFVTCGKVNKSIMGNNNRNNNGDSSQGSQASGSSNDGVNNQKSKKRRTCCGICCTGFAGFLKTIYKFILKPLYQSKPVQLLLKGIYELISKICLLIQFLLIVLKTLLTPIFSPILKPLGRLCRKSRLLMFIVGSLWYCYETILFTTQDAIEAIKQGKLPFSLGKGTPKP